MLLDKAGAIFYQYSTFGLLLANWETFPAEYAGSLLFIFYKKDSFLDFFGIIKAALLKVKTAQ